MVELNYLTACEIAQGIDGGKFRAEDVVRSCFDRIDSQEAEIQAWEHVDRDGALAAARRIDAGPRHGLLCGVPFGIKDVFDTSDMPTEYGSPIYSNHRPAGDASTVALLRRADAIALGKTVTTEFANVQPGKTRNPHDRRRTPGGSSSGSAAAVASHMVPLALGTQTTASTIRPASFCGTHAVVPSFAAISGSGIRQSSWSLDRPGIFARSISDLALFLHVLLGKTGRPDVPQSERPRIGFCRTHLWDVVEPYTASLLEKAAERLANAGAVVTDLPLPESCNRLTEAHRWISSFEFVRNFTYEIDHHYEQLSVALREGRIRDGLSCSYDTYRQACALAEKTRTEVSTILADVDVVLTVSAAGEAPIGTATGNPVFGAIWTVLRLPSLNIPAFTGPTGLPVGLQLVAGLHQEARLFNWAQWIEQHIG